jgi:2-dehydro-3-deoxyphosphogluconate aldolase/(4S)-4-hydroxy-2-oxoglutarate aldolase
MAPDEFLTLLARERVSAILRTTDHRLAERVMDVAVTAGFRVIEFTLTTPGALELIAAFSQRAGIVVGAGTVLTTAEVDAALKAGARFIVSPVVDEAVIRATVEAGATAMPGAHTPTELLTAHRAGAALQKLFPAPAGGPAWVRSVLGPMPFLRIVPTNGVDAANLASWLDAGSYGAGFVASLFEPAAMRAGDMAAVERNARAILAARDATFAHTPPQA